MAGIVREHKVSPRASRQGTVLYTQAAGLDRRRQLNIPTTCLWMTARTTFMAAFLDTQMRTCRLVACVAINEEILIICQYF